MWWRFEGKRGRKGRKGRKRKWRSQAEWDPSSPSLTSNPNPRHHVYPHPHLPHPPPLPITPNPSSHPRLFGRRWLSKPHWPSRNHLRRPPPSNRVGGVWDGRVYYFGERVFADVFSRVERQVQREVGEWELCFFGRRWEWWWWGRRRRKGGCGWWGGKARRTTLPKDPWRLVVW